MQLYCSCSSFLVHTLVNIFYMGQNTEVKFTNQDCLSCLRKQTYIAYKLKKQFMDNDFLYY